MTLFVPFLACEENQYGCGCCDISQPVYIGTGFQDFYETLLAEAADFNGMVYLVHGDSHYYQIFPNPTGDAENLVAIQVPGSTDIGWVEALISDDGDVSFVMVRESRTWFLEYCGAAET